MFSVGMIEFKVYCGDVLNTHLVHEIKAPHWHFLHNDCSIGFLLHPSAINTIDLINSLMAFVYSL